jgi:hypothetical protein
MTAADAATTRDVGTAPTVEVAPAAAPTGGGSADVSTAPPRGDEQALREQLGRLRRERDDSLETLQRVQAEYDNDRRRAKREVTEEHERGGQALAMRLLPVLDAFDAARAHSPGLLAPLHDARHGALRDAGLERVEPTGQLFDPAEQQAVEQLPRRDERPGAEDGPEPTASPRPWSWTRCCVRATAGEDGWSGPRWSGSVPTDST